MRIVDSAEAVVAIQSWQQVFLQGGAATPLTLLSALVERAPELRDVGIMHLHAEGPGLHLEPDMAGHFRHRALFIGSNARQAVAEGRADFVPVFLSDIPYLIKRRVLPVDVALINVSAPDAHGYCSLGCSVDVSLQAARSATWVVAQINHAMPRTLGNSFLHSSEIDLAVEVDEAPVSCPMPPIGDAERRIGLNVAELVPDGATLQMGIGAIPAAVALSLLDKRDLGIHTEMFTDAVVDLVERGVVTGLAKEVDRGKIVSAFLMGTERLYRFVHDNPMVEMHPADYTNDTRVIRSFDKMVAVNSALQIDLTGQVCADSVGERMYSGVGGQMDFVRGAALSPEGKAIIALPATACGGSLSRIVQHLLPGAGVVTTRAHVEYVVTEFGIAQLHGRSLNQRARALIDIAAPQFREELTAGARRRGLL